MSDRMTTAALRSWLKRRAESAGGYGALTTEIHATLQMPLPSHQTLRNFCHGMRVSPRIAGVLRVYATRAAARPAQGA